MTSRHGSLIAMMLLVVSSCVDLDSDSSSDPDLGETEQAVQPPPPTNGSYDSMYSCGEDGQPHALGSNGVERCVGLNGPNCDGVGAPSTNVWTCDAVRHDLTRKSDGLGTGWCLSPTETNFASHSCCGTLAEAESSYVAGAGTGTTKTHMTLNAAWGDYNDASGLTHCGLVLAGRTCPTPQTFCNSIGPSSANPLAQKTGAFSPGWSWIYGSTLKTGADYDQSTLVGPALGELRVQDFPAFLSADAGGPNKPFAGAIFSLSQAGRAKIGIAGISSGVVVARIGLDSALCTNHPLSGGGKDPAWCSISGLYNQAQTDAGETALLTAIYAIGHTAPCTLPTETVSGTPIGTGGNCRDLPFYHAMVEHGFGWYDASNMPAGLYGVFALSKNVFGIIKGHGTADVFVYEGNGGAFKPVNNGAPGSGAITVPATCSLATPSSTCSVTLSWTTSGSLQDATIWVKTTGAWSLFAEGLYGSSVASWITTSPASWEMDAGSPTYSGGVPVKSGTFLASATTVGVVAAPAAPTLSTPVNGATVGSQSPQLVWNKSTGATSYTLQVSTSASFTSFAYNQGGIGGTSCTPTICSSVPLSPPLASDTVYYWRVNATNGSTSGWSTVWNFRTPAVVPNPPILSTPGNGASSVSRTPQLVWNKSTGATTYTLQVSASASFTSFVYNQAGIGGTSCNTTTCSSVPLSPALATGTYYWRVNATNTSGGTSGWSSVWYFTTIASSGSFAGSATSCYLLPSNLCSAHVSWSATNTSMSSVYVTCNGGAYGLHATSLTGSETVPWITGGTGCRFDLRDGNANPNGTILATTTITGIHATCSLSAPSTVNVGSYWPVTATSVPTGLNIYWYGSGITDPGVYDSGGPTNWSNHNIGPYTAAMIGTYTRSMQLRDSAGNTLCTTNTVTLTVH